MHSTGRFTAAVLALACAAMSFAPQAKAQVTPGGSGGGGGGGGGTSNPPAPGPSMYFINELGRAVYLTGSHTWSNLQDSWTGSTPQAFDFTTYMNMLRTNNHNFVRLWRHEMTALRYDSSDPMHFIAPHPWLRTGPGTAGDGLPKFDLNQFDPAYFSRLRDRCVFARNRGMYVGVMLFEGHALANSVDGWFSHPFKLSNNINGVSGDPDGNGRGTETHTLDLPLVIAAQEAYVRKVIDTINDLDNVIIEISNESHPDSVEWQLHFIDYVKQYESTLARQHKVWFSTTFPNIDGPLWTSLAECVSPGTLTDDGAYRDDPPANDTGKIILNDTDHLWGCGGNGAWVWKSFTRGLNPIYMDGYDTSDGACSPDSDIRRQMGNTRRIADRMNLRLARPGDSLSSTGYCLVVPNEAYVAYAPNGGAITLNLAGTDGEFSVEWFRPDNNQTIIAAPLNGGASMNFTPPFSGPAVLFVSKPLGSGGIVGDINGDGLVNTDDLLLLLGSWGRCSACAADIDGNNVVNTDDMLALLGNWTG